MAHLAAAVRAAAATVQELDGADVGERIHALLSSPDYRPPVLPGAAVELLQLSQRPQVQFEDVVKVLERDPVFAARVVSLAQSAAYSSRSPVQTLQQAVVRLGLRGVRDVVLEAALHLKVFRAPGFEAPMARLARHCTATAHAVRAVCRRAGVDSENAFLCGLFHDVGFAAALLAICEDKELRTRPWAVLAPVLDGVHDDASGILAGRWGLPAPIRELVATHHEVTIRGAPSRLHAALVVAEQLAWEAGAGFEPPPPGADPLSMAMPEPPADGIDVNWTGLVEEARTILRLDVLGTCALRAEIFRAVGELFRPPKP